MMWRKKHREPEVREAIYRVGDKEIGIPYRPWPVNDGTKRNIGVPEVVPEAAASRVGTISP